MAFQLEPWHKWSLGGVATVIFSWLEMKFGPGIFDAIGSTIWKEGWEVMRKKLGFKEKRKKPRRVDDKIVIAKLQQQITDMSKTLKKYGADILYLSNELTQCNTARDICKTRLKIFDQRLRKLEGR